ncbi:Uncharacterised protein [Streptococcus pneumoniae]|nr:Uncharacterised protein [Streptococcus pneumoniae]
MNRCFVAILSPLNHQYCRSTTYHFLVSNLFLERLVFLVELAQLVALGLVLVELALQLVFQLLAVAVESSGYILLLIYEHSLLQLVFQLLAVAVESSGYILLLIYEHSLLQLVVLLTSLVLVVQLVLLGLVLVHQLHPTIDPIQLEVHLALLEAFLICPHHLKSNSLLHPLHFVSQQAFSPLLRFYHPDLIFYFESQG